MNELAPRGARQKGAQSASQLSENIGDVLASIRKLIAQDDGGTGEADAGTPGTRAEAAGRRRDLLAQASTLNRRDEAAGPAPLRLGPTPAPTAPTLDWATAVPRAVLTTRAAETTPVQPTLAAEAAPAPVIGAPAGPLVGVMGPFLPADPRAIAPLHDLPPLLDDPREDVVVIGRIGSAAVDDTPAGAAPTVEAVLPAEAAAGFAAPTRASETSPAAATMDLGSPRDGASVTAAPATAPTSPAPVADAPRAETPPAPDMTPSRPAMTDTTASPLVGGSILGEMIREVVRTELAADGVANDLRAMILRELAQVLTRSDRAR